MRVSESGGEEESVGASTSGDMVNEAVAGVSSILVERLLRRTGRGTSTLGFNDWNKKERERERDLEDQLRVCHSIRSHIGFPHSLPGFFLEIFRRGGRSINRYALDLTNVCT